MSVSKLISDKSAGNDGINSDFYKNTRNEIIPILHTLFNAVFNSGCLPKSWDESIICPIHKSGSKNDPGHFRGISLTTAMYKLFSTIINKRLYNWAEEHNKLDESQAGFRKGYSAVDNMFCLQAVMQRYLSRPGGRFYCLYDLT